MRSKKTTAILSVDIVDETVMPTRSAWKSLDSFLDQLNTKIEAVHVLQYPKRLLSDESIRKSAQKELTSFMKKAELENCSGSVVIDGSASLKESIRALLEHAVSRKAEFITLVSHGRRWLVRFIMGSFSETLLAMSPIPVFFMSRKSVSKGNRILYVTDFSKPSVAAFRIFLEQFKHLGGELVIYHALPPLYEYTAMMESYPPESRKFAESQMAMMSEIAENENWSARTIIEENVLDIPKGIQKVIKSEKIALIGFSSVATRYGFAFIGNVAKRIFRLDGVNKWVCGPAAIEKLLKKPKKPIRATPIRKDRGIEARF
jgi:nucleotide-binding universal stress UspA family protein